VGLGTTAPQRRLDVRGDAVLYDAGSFFSEGYSMFLSSGTGSGAGYNLHVGPAGTAPSASTLKGYYRVTPDGSRVVFGVFTGSQDIDAIVMQRATGNVGIGTANPTEKLEVAGTVKAASFGGSGVGLTGVALLGAMNTFNGAPTGTSVTQGVLVINPATATPEHTLLGIAVGNSERLRLTSEGNLFVSGNVGIGTTTPVSVLTVKGSGAAAIRHSQILTTLQPHCLWGLPSRHGE